MVNQTEFWNEIRKRRPGRLGKKPPRVVPAFTIQALQENTVVEKPPGFCMYVERPAKPTTFRKYYERGAFPVTLEMNGSVQQLQWKVKPEQLDYHFYLPLFFDGLCELKPPYTYLVEMGITQMLDACPVKVMSVLPQLIRPIKLALDTKIPDVICRTLRMVQRLVNSGDCIGEALVPYFRQILPVLNLMKDRCVNIGEEIDYSQQRGENVSDLIQETLEEFERHGGEDAFINIKYMVPTYESCTNN